MIDFLENHYLLVVAAISLIIETIVLIRSFRKSYLNKEDFIEKIINDILPSFINLAEVGSDCETDKISGESKLEMVVACCIDRIKKYISKDSIPFYRNLIVQKVERILSTPQKKEKL